MTPKSKRFPVLNPPDHAPSWVPWELVAPHALQALSNHSQTLERLAERGGLDICELAAVLDDSGILAYVNNSTMATVWVLTAWRDWALQQHWMSGQ